MKKLFGLIALFLILASCEEKKEKKVVLIIIDGVPADVLESVNTPRMDEIASVGGYARAYQGGEKGGYSQTPTISAPGYMNMITGVWGNKHNVWGNSVRNPNYNYWNIFRAAEELKPELNTAIFSTWLDNRTKLIGESKPEAGSIKLDYSFDGFELDTVAFPHNNGRLYIHQIDEHVTNEAAVYIKDEAPDVSWVYLEYTDDMGHGFGDSPQMIESVEMADDQIGRIWDAIKYREANFNEEWMIAVTTDHGRSPSDGKGHGGQSERERITWVVTNLSDLNDRFENDLAVVDIMPTALDFIGLELPESQRAELDGAPYAGSISIHSPKVGYKDGALSLSWKPVGTGNAEVLYSKTNGYAEGKKDVYESLGKASVKDGKFQADLQLEPGTYKFVIKGNENWVNTWLVLEDESVASDKD